MKLQLCALVILCVQLIHAQPEIELELFSDAFSSPVDIQNAGDQRLFIVEKGGFIRILNDNGTVNTDPFLDISSLVSGGSEQGLLGLAFHPDYSNNGFFYVNYTNNAGDTRVSRFSVDPGDPDLAVPGSELQLLAIDQPFSNHNAGSLAFGPDGYLYVTTGDGGSGGDPGDRAQNTQILLGKMLRIDVDNPGGGNNYGIPPDNPFVNDPPNAPEIWAYGLRNPWKFSFDRTTDNIWIADVGQGSIEEMNKQSSATPGLNYGWRCYEGTQPFNTTGCPPMGDLTFPEAEYTHSGSNCSITGGYVYRGTEYPNMQGYYFAADLCSGRIFTVDGAGNLIDHGTFGGTWVSFGEDINKELYISDISGDIYRVTDASLIGVDTHREQLFRIFPNPARETLHIESSLPLEKVRVISLLGAEVLNIPKVSNELVRLDVSRLKSGLYLVEIKDSQGNKWVDKLIIQ